MTILGCRRRPSGSSRSWWLRSATEAGRAPEGSATLVRSGPALGLSIAPGDEIGEGLEGERPFFVRLTAEWATIEPERGAYDWSTIEPALPIETPPIER